MKLVPLARKQGEFRTYELTTVGGAANAILQMSIPFAAICWAVVNMAEQNFGWINLAVFAGAGLALAAVVMPAWIYTVMRLGQNLERERRETATITEKVKLRNIDAEIDSIRLESLRVIATMDNDHLNYALTLQSDDVFRIEGHRVSWIVNSVKIPPSFALDWLEKWRARDESGDKISLPANHDWDKDPHRELLRQYNSAIIDALVTQGVVKAAGGPHPPRWLVHDPNVRNQSLANIGLWVAASWAIDIVEHENKTVGAEILIDRNKK